jgi:asparagine synthetase B (glutamine-hydrolysing)
MRGRFAAGAYPWILLDTSCRPGGFVTSVDTASGAGGDGRLVVEALGQDWLPPAGGSADSNVIEWTDTELVVRTSRQNFTPVYHWVDARRERLLIGTDLASLTAKVISATDPSGDLVTQIRSARADIRKIPGRRTVRFTDDSGISVADTAQAGWASADIVGETAADAGLRQIGALERDIAAVGDRRPVTALVSGGVDSGTVAALARHVGVLDGIATLGTVWGDERAEAEELGAHLGCPVQYVLLSEDDILDALPDTIRMLGEPGRETVAIASNLVALYRRGEIPAGALLTGYGSDLINSGLRVDAEVLDDLRGRAQRGVLRRRRRGLRIRGPAPVLELRRHPGRARHRPRAHEPWWPGEGPPTGGGHPLPAGQCRVAP